MGQKPKDYGKEAAAPEPAPAPMPAETESFRAACRHYARISARRRG